MWSACMCGEWEVCGECVFCVYGECFVSLCWRVDSSECVENVCVESVCEVFVLNVW